MHAYEAYDTYEVFQAQQRYELSVSAFQFRIYQTLLTTQTYE